MQHLHIRQRQHSNVPKGLMHVIVSVRRLALNASTATKYFLATVAVALAQDLSSAQTLPTSEDGHNTYEVILHDEAPYFNPKQLRVPLGSTVTWKNVGPALVHSITITTDSNTTQSGSIFPGKSWTHTFNQASVVRTACGIHPYMFGFVIVGEVAEEAVSAIMTHANVFTSQATKAEIMEFPMPVVGSVPGIIEIDPQDNAWFTMGGGGWGNIAYPPLALVGRLSIAGEFDQYTLPTDACGSSGLSISPDGVVFVTELMSGRIARIDWKSKVVEEYPIQTNPAWPTGLDIDGGGNVWFSMTRGNKVGLLNAHGTVREFPLPTVEAHPTGLKLDQAGNVWIAERDAGKIACLRPDETFVEFGIPTPKSKPSGIDLDEDGRVWFAERAGNAIGVIENGSIREYPLPTPNSGPFFLRVDYHGHVWFTETYGNRIGVLDPKTGAVNEYNIPTADSWPGGLAFDSQGNVWFTEQLGNKVAVLLHPKNDSVQ